MLESKEKFNEKDIFISAAQGFSSKFYDSEYNSAAISALNDDFVETNFWRLLDEKKKLEGTLTKKQIREKQQAMQISAKKMFQQDVSQVEADAKMSELKQEISESLASMVEDFGLIADVMSIKRHGCILIYDPGDSCAVSSIMNAIGVLKAKITSSISWRENQTFNIITRGAMLDDTVCNFPDLVTSICEELAGKSITVCNQIQFLQSDFTNHSEALKLSAFIQMIPEEQPTVIFCYGLQNINRTERLSAEICPEKVPPWVLLILHAVCAPSRAAETLIRSSFRGKCEIFGSLSQSPRNSFVAMVEQLFIARCTPLDAQALSLCKSVYCGKHGVLTTKCHIMMFAKCLEWDVFDDDSGLLKLSSELRDQPNQVIVKYYILGVIKKFRFSMISTFAALSLMAASKCEVPFATIVAFTKFVKTQNKDTLMKGFSVRPSMRKKDVLDVLSKIQQAITIEEVCVKTTEWNLFFEHFKILMTPTIILRGSQECFALNDGILKLDVQTVTGAILSQSFSKTVLLAIRYYEPWHIEQRARDEQISNVMKYRDLMPMVMELGLQAFALDLLLDFDFVSHYVDEGYSRQLEVFYLQASEFLDCTELLQQSATILRDIQRFLAHNRTLFLSGIKYDFLSLLFNFNGGSKYFEAVMKFRETKRQKGDEVNSVWVINRSEYGKRDTLRWISEARGEVRAWYLMNELESRYCAISIDMPEPRLMILNAVTGQPLWTSPQNLISESQIKIKSSNDNVYLVSCSKAKVYLWKKTGTYAESGYAAVYSFQLLKCDISGFDLSPNDSNFCTYNDTEGLTVTAWSIVMNTANIDKLDHLNIAATSVYHVGLSSILKFACFLSWENVLLTSESNGQLTLLYIHKSSFGLTTNPGSSLSEIIRWNIPNSHATERRASSMQWLKDRNVLVLYDLDFVIFYELILNFDDVGCPVAKVSALKSLQNGFAPGNWYSSPMISVTIVDPRMPELNMNLTDKSLDDTLIAIILTEKNICVWSTQPYNNLPEQILVEFSSKESRIAQIILNKAGCLILNCSDRSIVQRVLEIARYGMIDNSPANGCIDDIHFTSDDSMIICSCKSGEVSLYSGTSGLLKVCQMMNQSGISFCSAFSCLVGIAYSGDHDGNICCYNVKAKAKLPNLKYHQCAVTAMVVSQSELMLASGDSEGNLIIWSTRSGQILLRIPEAHSDSITQVKFSPDSSTLWSSSLDGRVASWMCTNGQGLQASRVSDVTAQSFDISANM
jgi:WD40 repeat protein